MQPVLYTALHRRRYCVQLVSSSLTVHDSLLSFIKDLLVAWLLQSRMDYPLSYELPQILPDSFVRTFSLLAS